MKERHDSSKPWAFLFFGGLVAGRYPNWLNVLAAKGLHILNVDTPNPRSLELLRQAKEVADHPINLIKEVRLIDHMDVVGILAAAQEWSSRYEIVGTQTLIEYYVPPCAWVADFLKLPSCGLRASQISRDKALQRLFLAEWSPGFQFFSHPAKALAYSWKDFPVVVKPTRRQASSGVVRCETQDDLVRALKQYKEDEAILIEQCIEGTEVSVESLIQKRTVIFDSITDKVTNGDSTEFFVEMGHTVPCLSLSEPLKARILAANWAILRELAFENGISHAEFKVTADGRIYLMEIAARAPGDMILELYRLASGSVIEEAVINIALGESVPPITFKKVARQVFFGETSGILRDVEVQDKTVEPIFYREGNLRPYKGACFPDPGSSLEEIFIDIRRGGSLGTVKDSFNRLGYFIVSSSRDLIDQTEQSAKRSIRLLVDQVEQ